MLAPYAPHLAEELWVVLGHTERSIFEERWPTYDAALAVAGDVEIAVQVNGRLRGRVTVPRGTPEADVVKRALADESVRRFVDGNPIKKTIEGRQPVRQSFGVKIVQLTNSLGKDASWCQA